MKNSIRTEDYVLAHSPMTVGELKRLLSPILDDAIVTMYTGPGKASGSAQMAIIQDAVFVSSNAGTDMFCLVPMVEEADSD